MINQLNNITGIAGEKMGEGIDQMEEWHRLLAGQSFEYVHQLLNLPSNIYGLKEKQDNIILDVYAFLRRVNLVAKDVTESLIHKDAAERLQILGQLLHYRLTWEERDLDYKAGGNVSPKFMSAREALGLVKSNAVVYSSGFAGAGRCSILYWALRERFEKERSPRNLTWVAVSGQGGRGKAPGTIEEIGIKGLMTKYICGHVETARSLLKLADEGALELHTMPQGELAYLIDAQGMGKNEIRSTTGLGTFLDPRQGRGSCISDNARTSLITAKDNELSFRLPLINTALLSAPAADSEGNIYFDNAAVITEIQEGALAARYNGGLVIISVGEIIEKDESRIALKAELVDAVVLNERNEQVGGVPQNRYWPMFTENAREDQNYALSTVKLINTIMGITPQRRDVDRVIARMAAQIFARETAPGSLVNIGIGMPEEVSRLLMEHNLHKELTFTTEAGAYGGIPTSGIFFGAAVNPEKIRSSAWMFRQYEENLKTTILGFLQVDSQGNVNVSRKGPNNQDYVGPGGFCNITRHADVIIFTGSWNAKGRIVLKDEALHIDKPGKSKFVNQVDEITFNGREALKAGKKVYYATDVGLFQLRDPGLTLLKVMPGVNIQKDILDAVDTKIVFPDGKIEQVEKVNLAEITGEGFNIKLRSRDDGIRSIKKSKAGSAHSIAEPALV